MDRNATAAPATSMTETPVFSVTTDKEGDGVLILQLSGELDLATCSLLEPDLLAAESSGARRVVLDLSALEFIDAKGLGLLLRATERSRANGGRLTFLRPVGPVERLLALTGFDSVLPFDD